MLVKTLIDNVIFEIDDNDVEIAKQLIANQQILIDKISGIKRNAMVVSKLKDQNNSKLRKAASIYKIIDGKLSKRIADICFDLNKFDKQNKLDIFRNQILIEVLSDDIFDWVDLTKLKSCYSTLPFKEAKNAEEKVKFLRDLTK